MEEKVYKELTKALTALEITNSATHSEFKITPSGDVRIIEIGARMGGDCIGSDLVQISTGYDFVKMVIDVAMGNKPSFEKVTKPKVAAIKFIFNQNDVNEYEKVREKMPNEIYRVSQMEAVGTHDVIDSSSRFGYYILACDNYDKIGWLFENGEKEQL